jgi:VanZ family protein
MRSHDDQLVTTVTLLLGVHLVYTFLLLLLLRARLH